jgi:uncharacterized surface protein with fasciclin (FAS1) repeats
MHFTRLLTTAAALAMTAGMAMAQTSTQGSAMTPAAPAQNGAGPNAGSTPLGGAAPAPPPGFTKVVAKGDIIETARASGEFTTFLKAVDATNLTSVLKTNKNLTVFAPTDAAFAAMPAAQRDQLLGDKAQLQKVLTYHVINAKVDSSKIRGAKGPVMTVAGSPVELDGSGDKLMINDADIIQADVMATNGVLNVIDKVLIPGTAVAATANGSPASATAGTTGN